VTGHFIKIFKMFWHQTSCGITCRIEVLRTDIVQASFFIFFILFEDLQCPNTSTQYQDSSLVYKQLASELPGITQPTIANWLQSNSVHLIKLAITDISLKGCSAVKLFHNLSLCVNQVFL